MARLSKPPPFYGTKDGATVYKMWDKDFIRTKSSLTGKTVKTAPEFEKTRHNAKVLARASKIASLIYATLSLQEKHKSPYKMLTGRVMKMLNNGVNEWEIAAERS